jgi:uncharacterized membrane protein
MICSECSAEMPEISAYCPVCGSPVDEAQDPYAAKDVLDRLLATGTYVIVPALVVLSIPRLRSRPFVRFHAWQAVLVGVATVALALVVRLLFFLFSLFPFGGNLLAWLLVGVASIAIVILWAALLTIAALGNRYELPLLGGVAARLAA